MGIPFAAPPVGELRFKAPQPPEGWTGVRDAFEPGPSAPQGVPTMPHDVLPSAIDEDCLYLNVFTPGIDGAKRPVMFFIHGGGFMSGSGSLPMYDGCALARTGDVVVVTINYRLGALGFAYLTEVCRGTIDADTNVGIRDQIAALEWVRDNIEAFGGDPENVTIFGESAGAMSVGTLLGVPSARGLFHRAILQSGAAHNVHTGEEANVVAERLLETLGIDAARASKLKEIDASLFTDSLDELNRFVVGALVGTLPFQPVVDGELIPRPPLESIRQGLNSEVPVIAGTNRDEWNLFTFADSRLARLDQEGLIRRFEKRHPGVRASGEAFARDIVETYSAALKEATGETPQPKDIWCAAMTDAIFRVPAIRLCEAVSANGADAFSYLFTYQTPAAGGIFKSCHALELPFVFGTYRLPALSMFVGTGEEVPAISRSMQECWTSFARSGRPESAPLPEWPTYSEASRPTMIFEADAHVASDPGGPERRVWDGLV